MEGQVPLMVEERPTARRASGAPNRIPKSVVAVTILALVDALLLFGSVVAVMTWMSKGNVEGRHSDYDDDFDLDSYGLSFIEGLASPALFVALVGILACLLTLCAELTSCADAKTKVRNGVGVIWAINIGLSLVSAIIWGTIYFQAFLLYPSFTTPIVLFLVAMVSNLVLFVWSIVLTVICYATGYSSCSCCCPSSGDYQVFYATETGEVYYPPTVIAPPPPGVSIAPQPMMSFAQVPLPKTQ
ncbi:uncharacterized protein [Oscarella lobularis]|uniref:uncharacterized protein n=1 Tax=Oscarella lobularis TaxID=121494 RepID=UPI003313AA46